MGPTIRKRPRSVDQQVFEKQANICKAFANPIRLHLLDLLGQRNFTVSELQRELGITKANLSQHLAVLRGSGVVITHHHGKQVVCALAVTEIKQACQLIRNVLRAQIREARRMAE